MFDVEPRRRLPDEGCRTRRAKRRPREFLVSWIVLVISGVLEAVWATALGKSAGFSKLSASVVFVVALVASMAGLAYAMRDLPVGTAYAVWVGIGAVLTVVYAMATGDEPPSLLKAAFLVMIIGGVVGLKLVH
jgi:quaternary ammonium compound-resistance protein SugE